MRHHVGRRRIVILTDACDGREHEEGRSHCTEHHVRPVFEDINYAADGGLYGELVKNRSFEFPQSFMGWQTFGNIELKADGPFERCPHYVVLSDPRHSDRRTGLVNEGYFGIGVLKGEEYRFTVWAKAPKGTGRITVQLIDWLPWANVRSLFRQNWT